MSSPESMPDSTLGASPIEASRSTTGRYRASTPWRLWSGSLATIGIVIAAMVAYGIGMMAFLMAFGGPFSGPGDALQDPVTFLAAALCGMLLAQVASVVLTWFMAGRRGGRPGEVLALQQPVPGGAVGYLTSALLFCALALAAGFAISLVWPHDSLADLKLYLPLIRSEWWWLLVVVAVVGAPIAEEILFRGFIVSFLARSRLGFAGAAVISSALWTAMHAGYSAQGLTLIFLLGLILSAILWRTGSLRAPIFCHAVYNAGSMAFLLWYAGQPGMAT